MSDAAPGASSAGGNPDATGDIGLDERGPATHMARDTVVVTVCTLVSRITGFVRVLVAAAVTSMSNFFTGPSLALASPRYQRRCRRLLAWMVGWWA